LVRVLGDAEAAPAVVVISLGAQALAYAARGWPVFPCRPNADPCPQPDDCPCKRPLTLHGCRDATADTAVIREWWHRWHAANVAIATGAPGPDVLDVDVTANGTGWPAFSRLKRAGLLTGARALVRTPRGGLHVYYCGTGQPNGSLARAGHFVDFRGAGGYVLAPPSRVHGRPYELLDHRGIGGQLDWQAVRRLLNPPSTAPPPRASGAGGIDALAAFVAGLGEGNRNNGLYWAACRAVETGSDPGRLVAAAVTAGLSETEAHRTIDSARRTSQ
jgi:hypothetical protein